MGKNKPALRVGHGALDLLFLFFWMFVFFATFHIEKFQILLSGEKCKKEGHARISTAFKPGVFTGYCEALQPINAMFGEDLRKIISILGTTLWPLDVESMEAAAISDNLTSKF